MSGFGGGFGFGSPPAPAAPFGSQPPASASGFGGNGFGATAPAAPFGGGGFGSSPPSSGFVQPTPAPNGGFGSLPAPTFGSAAAPVFGAAPAIPFGNSQPAVSQPFGTAPAVPAQAANFGFSPNGLNAGFGQPSSGFGSSNSNSNGTGFGNAPSGFGNSSSGFGNSSSGFGSNTPSSGFGNVSAGFAGTNHPAPPFGSAPQNSAFGPSSTPAGPFNNNNNNNINNPFGAALNTTPLPAVSFGASSNVITTPSVGFGASSSSSAGWGTPASTGASFGSNPFGNSYDAGMQQQSDNEDMGDGTASHFSQSKFGVAPSTEMTTGSLSPVPEETNMAESSSPVPPFGGGVSKSGEEMRLRAKMEERKLLQAKIEEKKRKLLERQKMKKNLGKDNTSLNAEAVPFAPSGPASGASSGDTDRSSLRFGSQSGASAAEATLADRNALRFGSQTQSSSTRSYMPAHLRGKAEQSTKVEQSSGTDHENSIVPKDKNREELENAVSLVGICQFMCPDDELLRREKEGDIQQLEIPQPGTLHPENWSLRETAVKRFRRSAADYKLDVPEWVRPPDVLEKVCGYLEEWVMERDRQGPDPRFPQGQTPPSLDVYQFIWDRTRMIRKDFTLQNYVGTGGNCDARAVRCHERIARWHTMCEHQLSHISDFTNQSVQNMMELGQTMKTLNQFYDDSLNRAIVEVPDEEGRETRSNRSEFSHGCASAKVQGKDPVDFDGTPLNNAMDTSAIAKRLVGQETVNNPTRGTAEPEMRGLYILLTMNNDGGMEVLKYAAKLFQERPAIYHSQPVQLALSIYKAKKEYNYARFFSILRSPTTPYLFCCIMFKHVELIRKVAFRIMSKTFGARKKDTGEAIYDAYPLNRLVELLCFEDADEARTACKHYNITVKDMKISSPSDPLKSGIADVVFWRKTDFKEPKHPEKGFVLPLQPKKMIKTIERKLNGATRLAVCRGEVSGDGAALSTVLSHTMNVAGAEPRAFAETLPELKAQQDREEAETTAKAAALLMKQKMERARLDVEVRKQREEEHRLVQETERKEAVGRKLEQEQLEVEKRRQEIEASREEALARRQKEEEKRKTEIEFLRQQEIEDEDRRQKEREAKATEEMKRRKEAEEKRIRMEEEAARKRVEEAETRRKEDKERHLRELERHQAEEERKHKAVQEIMHREAEFKRLKEARRQEEERRRREAEERRIENEWRGRIEASRRFLVWRCWRQRVSRQLATTQAATTCLQHIDPTFSGKISPFHGLVHQALAHADSIEGEMLPDRLDTRQILERLLHSRKAVSMNLANIALEEVKSSSFIQEPMRNGGAHPNGKFTVLLKVAVVLPRATEMHEESICELVVAWIDSRLQFNKVSVKDGYDKKGFHFEVRVVTTHGNSNDRCSDCDIALIVVPPPWCKIEQESVGLESAASGIDDEVPRVVLVLGEEFDVSYFTSMNKLIGAQCGGGTGKLSIIYPSSLTTEAFEKALSSACKTLVKIFVEESRVHVDRIPMMQLGAMAICNALWKYTKVERCYDGKLVLECASSALLNAISEVEKFRDENEKVWSKWPPRDFASGDVVKDYFSNQGDLPVNWGELLNKKVVDVCLAELLDLLKGSFHEVIDRLLSRAPQIIRDECEAMIGRRQFRRCLERALLRRQRLDVSSYDGDYLYLPSGMLPLVIDRATKTLREDRNEADVHIIEIESEVDSHANRAGSVGVMSKSGLTKANQVSSSAVPPGSISHRDVGTSSTMGNKSNKRSVNDMESPDFLRRGDLCESTGLERSDKKRRDNCLSSVSIEQNESAAFTKRLEQLLHGETIDLAVGETTLSAFLRSVPKIDF